MAVQGPVIAWVADHRKHHAHTDEEGDPHSPHVGHGDGVARRPRAASGTRTSAGCSTTRAARTGSKYAPDLFEDPGMRFINRHFLCSSCSAWLLPALAGFAPRPARSPARSPACCGAASSGSSSSTTSPGASTRSATSSATRRFETDDQSTNVFWLALPSLGESWHHNHHAFPRSAVHGLRRREIDPSGVVIAVMEKVGLARNVIRIAPERQAQKVAAQKAAEA